MGAGTWNEGGEAGDEVDGVEHDMGGAVPEGALESIHDLRAVIDRETFVRQRGAGDVAAQAFEGVAFMGFAHGAGMEGEPRELGDAGVVGRRAGADGAQRQGLAPGVGAGGDVVRPLRGAESPHAVGEPRRRKPHLGVLVALADLAEHLVRRNPEMVDPQLVVPSGEARLQRLLPAHRLDGGVVVVDEEHGCAAAALDVLVGAGHDDVLKSITGGRILDSPDQPGDRPQWRVFAK